MGSRLAFLLFAVVLLAGSLATRPVLAEPRLALVVGNTGYTAVAPLDNAGADAALMADSLRQAGFSVTLLADADQATLNRAIVQFGRDLRSAGADATGLFYYAGHGVQSFGSNYLLPVDASLTDAADLGLVAVPAQTVLQQMSSARNRTNIVILDACRNNPFQSIPDLGDNGLAEMKAPTGTFLAYSTEPGAVALDGASGNSPFTKALATHMLAPGLPIEQVFREVRVQVLEETGKAQTPWDSSSLTTAFTFVPAAAVTVADVAADQLWQSVRASRDPVQIMLFLRGYPGSAFDDEARKLLTEVMQSEIAAAPAPAPPPQPAPTAAPAPDEAERAAIAVARSSRLAADYRAYLDQYPSGAYAELAAYELALLEKAGAAPPPATPDLVVTFDSPLTVGGEGVAGFSIAELVTRTPLYPPIEGIPESMWKDHSCTSCHEWTREALCTQGGTYTTASAARALEKPHPYGLPFKQALRAWAADDCP